VAGARIACVDVDYGDDGVTAAAVGFEAWTDAVATVEVVVRSRGAASPYQPGAFYARELPYLLGVLARMPPLELVIVDAYVALGPDHPGLGWHLHAARGGIVVGVAKTRYPGADAVELVRGEGTRPLYVTAIGMEVDAAAAQVAAMHGEFRVPTLVKLADTLARGRR